MKKVPKKKVSCENRSDLRVPLEGLRDPSGPQGAPHWEPWLCSSQVVSSPSFPLSDIYARLGRGPQPLQFPICNLE